MLLLLLINPTSININIIFFDTPITFLEEVNVKLILFSINFTSFGIVLNLPFTFLFRFLLIRSFLLILFLL